MPAKTFYSTGALCLLLGLLFVGSLPLEAQESRYLVAFREQGVETAAGTRLIEEAGGTMVRDQLRIGIAAVTSSDPDFMVRLRQDPSVLTVSRDDPRPTSITQALSGMFESSPTILRNPARSILGASSSSNPVTGRSIVTDPTQADLWDLQWNLMIMQLPEAWEIADNLGDPNVTVAVVDTGIDYIHEELRGKVDLEHSVSFVPEDDDIIDEMFPEVEYFMDLNFHGTLSAGQIACNAIATACPAPNVTLLAVKVLNSEGAGEIGTVAEGILYAADLGVDVINLGFVFNLTRPDDVAGIVALRRAVAHAKQQGTVVFSDAGLFPDFELVDADDNGSDFIAPAEAGGIVVSSTDPFDLFSNFNNFGESLVDISGPGGRPPEETDPADLITFIFGPCSSFSLIPALEACRPDAQGNFASLTFAGALPAVGMVSGLAALIDSQHGGALRGLALCDRILFTADDVEAPGFDALTGHGRVNALRALTEDP